MVDTLKIKNNTVSLYGYRERSYHYRNNEELCDVLFNYFNRCNHNVIFLKKKVLFENERTYKVIQEGIYTNEEGMYPLQIVVDKQYLPLLKAYLHDFGYKKQKEDKEFKKILK